MDIKQTTYLAKLAEISALLLLLCWMQNFLIFMSTEIKQLKLETCESPSLTLSMGQNYSYRCQISGCYILNSPFSRNLIGMAFGYLPGTLLVYILLKYFSRRTALGIIFIGIALSLVPHCLYETDIFQSTVFVASIMFITSTTKLSL